MLLLTQKDLNKIKYFVDLLINKLTDEQYSDALETLKEKYTAKTGKLISRFLSEEEIKII